MKIRFAVVAATSAFAALPGYGQGIQVTAGTNVTISGLLAVGVKNSQLGKGNSTDAAWANRSALPSETHVDDNTSRLIISSTSKITDGWNVIFRVESRFTADTRPGDNATQGLGLTVPVANASGWADGDTFGGVSSPYGTITVGKSTLYYTDTISAGYLAPVLEAPGESQRIWDANGLATFNILSSYLSGAVVGGTFVPGFAKNILGNTRSRNVIRYDSIFFKPTGKDLLDFSLAYTKNAAGPENEVVPTGLAASNGSLYASGSTVYARMRYNGYGISASGSYLDQKFQGIATTAANTELKATRLGASYKWEGLKFGIIYDSTNSVNGVANGAALSDATRTAFAVPVSYSFGDHAVYATYATAGNTSGYADSGAKQINLGYDYAMTKRAFVGVWVTKLENGANGYYAPFLAGYSFGGSTVMKGESFTQFGINLNYWF
jgi:predicted porin